MGMMKAAGIGCAGVILAPVVAVGYGVLQVYAAITKFGFKYPKTAAAGVLTAVAISYNCSGEWLGAKTKEYWRQGESSIERIVEQYERRDDANRLKQYAQQVTLQNAQLSDALKRQQGYTAAIESKLTATEQAMQQEVQRHQELPTPPPTPEAKPQQPATIEHPEYYFHYVDIDNTLDEIGRAVSTNPQAAKIIAVDNGIQDPRTLMAGQLLKIKRTLCTKSTRMPMYERAPVLQSVILPGNLKISEFFQGDALLTTSTLELNKRLGLSYEDAFPYKQGARVVYYER